METEPQIIEQYVKTGKARIIYHYTIQIGEGSRTLAEATECAGTQGKYWEMRELIYRTQEQFFRDTSYAALQPLVAGLGLAEAPFQQCFEQGQFRQQVQDNNAAVQRDRVRSDPTVDINGTRIVGAQPFEVFQQVLDATQ